MLALCDPDPWAQEEDVILTLNADIADLELELELTRREAERLRGELRAIMLAPERAVAIAEAALDD